MRSSPACSAPEAFTAITVTGGEELSRKSREVTYATKVLEASAQDMKDNKSLARRKECKTQEKYHTLLSLAERYLLRRGSAE